MEKDIIDILESRKVDYSDIVVYIFDNKKDIVRYRNKCKSLNKNISLTTIDEIREYKLDGYRIKDYKYFGGTND